MFTLKRADYEGIYHGFNLKEGFWYGKESETGQYVATSGWEVNGCVAIYRRLEDGKWEMAWYDIESTQFWVDMWGLMSNEGKGKKTFDEWLLDEYGISPEEWDENYGYGIQGDQIWEEYERYRCDGLPAFVRKYL